MDPYSVLGVTRRASREQIARAYRRAVRESHPDTGRGGSAKRFQAVTDAYELLRDPRRRAVYDRSHPLPAVEPEAPTCWVERDMRRPTSFLDETHDWTGGVNMPNLLIRDPFLAAPLRLMDELMRSSGNGNRVTGFTPPVDVYETDEEYQIGRAHV